MIRLLIITTLSLIAGCSIDSSDKNQRLIIGEWICDSVQTSHLTYKPENNGSLFYKKGVRKIIQYTSDSIVNVTGQRQNSTKFIIKDRLLYVIEEGFTDSIKKLIIRLDTNKMVLLENAAIWGNVVFRGGSVGNESMRLFYTRK